MTRTRIYGTLGPKCCERELLKDMIAMGMTGVRLNLSHVSLKESEGWLDEWHAASKGECDLLIDMQGPEMRIGHLDEPVTFLKGDQITVPIREGIAHLLEAGMDIKLDDGRYHARIKSIIKNEASLTMKDDGVLSGGKSIKIPGMENELPALSRQDRGNLILARDMGVTGVMQPFVRGAGDLIELKDELARAGAHDVEVFAKIENRRGVERLDHILAEADWAVIARGDLGNDIPLWELPRTQRRIAAACRRFRVPFIVVTQMLFTMEHSPVPTRAEISDIDHAIIDGAAGVMVTGETAMGDYPLEVIRYLANTVKEVEAEIGSYKN